MKLFINLLMATLLTLSLNSCSNAAENSVKRTTHPKGVQQFMKTYYIGRFAIDVPAEFNLAVQRQKLRYAELSDFMWNSADHGEERERLWQQRVTEIKRLPMPFDKKPIVIEVATIPSIGKWAKGILYHGDYLLTQRLFYTVLVDYTNTAVWLTIAGTNKDKMLKNFTNILTHYEPGLGLVPKDGFYLKHGKVLLPYIEQEASYARFEGPMGMVLRVETAEIHKAPEREGIIDRTVAAMATGFASGLDIEKIRSQKKVVAGLPGEEEILVGDDGRRKNVSFDWEYLGSVESGEQPMIQITVDTEADNLDEKIRIWDKVLKSFRPAYQH